jgi:hypothetical protein
VANLPRRRFLKTIGGAAVATVLRHAVLGAQPQKRAVAVLWEPEFRHVQGCDISRETLQAALENFTVDFLGERDLIAQLDAARYDLLVTPYGSAFPKRIWPALLKYLRAGGNWLNIGGVPLSRPVVRDGSRWLIEPAQNTFHKRLGITHWFSVDTPKNVNQIGFKTDKVFELYVRLRSTNNEPDEAGSDGPHEGVVRPMTTMVDSEGRAVGAPAIQIDRLVRDTTNAVVSQFNVIANKENSKATISVKLPDAAKLAPGFYKIEAQSSFNLLTHNNGFWIYDEALLARGKALTVDKHFFYRDGKVFPVTGTTYMASDKHRRFLFGFASKVLVLRFLCATSVFSVSLWCVFVGIYQPQRHREHRGCTEKSAVWTFRAKLSSSNRIHSFGNSTSG